MKNILRRGLVIFLFILPLSLVYTHPSQEQPNSLYGTQIGGVEVSESTVSILDNAVRILSRNIGGIIVSNEEISGRIGIGQFTHRGNVPPLGEYWHNQLTGDLVNIPNRSFTVLSGAAGADWILSGEIVEVAEIIRVYTRLTRSSDRAIEAAFNSDFERNVILHQMLASAGSAWASSWEFPVIFEIGQNSGVPAMNRTLQEDGEDHFLLVPDADGRLIIETTGSIDTYIELFDAESRNLLDEDDDSGSGRNARVVYDVQAGRRYMALVTGFSSSTRGSYGFRAFYNIRDNNWDNPIIYEIGQNSGVPVLNRTLTGGDEDFFLLIPESDGRLTAETTGNTDTYIEFYDAESRDRLAQNDDGGAGLNARIVHNVEAGRSYMVKVRGFSSSTSGNYAFRAFLQTPDNMWDNPIPAEIGQDERHPVINRSLDAGNEEFFLLLPESDGRLTVETTGSIDTFMEFYDGVSGQLLASNDDGGVSLNARIRFNVEGGHRYVAMVRGYSSSTSGNYGFLAYLLIQADLEPDEFEPNDDPDSAGWIEIDTPQTHTFHHADDVDWLRFRVEEAGLYTIRARGVNSDRLDTYIELFDANLHFIAEDDDGGDFRDSMLSMRLNSGVYFIKVWCLDDEPDQPYTISIVREE